jgi:hypothetical protein
MLILASLGTGVFYLSKDSSEQTRVVKTLTIRVALSISLIILILTGYFLGEIRPHGIQ